MAVVRKKRRKLKLEGAACLFIIFSFTCSLICSLFVRSYNNSVAVMVQETQQQIETIKIENEALKVQIQNLASQERVYSVAESNGMSVKEDKVVTIKE